MLLRIVFTLCLLIEWIGADALCMPHEERRDLHYGWAHSPLSDVDRNTELPMRIALKQQNLHQAATFLKEVSDPESPSFGQYWRPQRLLKTFAPSVDTISAVKSWLVAEGINPQQIMSSQSGGWLYVNITVQDAERLLKTSYQIYIHRETREPHLDCESYYVPENLRHHIDFITPTSLAKLVPRSNKVERRDSRSVALKESGCSWIDEQPSPELQNIMENITFCDSVITPACLRALYGIPAPTTTYSNNSYGIVEYGIEHYLQSDLDMFFAKYFEPLVGRPPRFASIDGGQPGQNVSANQRFSYDESDLDLEYAMALVYPLNVTLYQTGDIDHGGNNNNFLDAIDGTYCLSGGGNDPIFDPIHVSVFNDSRVVTADCGIYEPPNVVSISYGKDEYYRSRAYSERQCIEFLKLGLRGVTVLFPSGDNGVAGNHGCLAHVNATTFSPMFPAVCPFVTSVGATQVSPNATVFSPESAASGRMRSGGGFSNYFPIPDYQKEAVMTWFRDHPTGYDAQVFNTSRATRGYPDVAVNGVNYLVAEKGKFHLASGTSASTPVFGAIIALINEARLNVGKGPVGFLNPVLYSNPQVFNDITSGSNAGCNLPGFNATIGWDPVTGLGTPDFPQLRNLYLSLP